MTDMNELFANLIFHDAPVRLRKDAINQEVSGCGK